MLQVSLKMSSIFMKNERNLDMAILNNQLEKQVKIQTIALELNCSLELVTDAYAGQADSQTILGYYYFSRGKYNEACQWYQASAEGGDIEGAQHLAEMHKNGHGVKQDISNALKWVKIAFELLMQQANDGKLEAQYEIAEFYYPGGDEHDGEPFWYQENWKDWREPNVEKAVFWYQKAADNHDNLVQRRLAQRKLANILYQGLFTPKNLEQALELYLKSESNLELAHIYANDVFKKNISKSLQYLKKIDIDGVHGKRDFELLEQILLKADFLELLNHEANTSVIDSQFILAWMYEKGIGVMRDWRKAIILYQALAERGCDEARLQLFYSLREQCRYNHWNDVREVLNDTSINCKETTQFLVSLAWGLANSRNINNRSVNWVSLAFNRNLTKKMSTQIELNTAKPLIFSNSPTVTNASLNERQSEHESSASIIPNQSDQGDYKTTVEKRKVIESQISTVKNEENTKLGDSPIMMDEYFSQSTTFIDDCAGYHIVEKDEFTRNTSP